MLPEFDEDFEVSALATEIANESLRDAAEARRTARMILPWMRRICRSWDNRALYARLAREGPGAYTVTVEDADAPLV